MKRSFVLILLLVTILPMASGVANPYCGGGWSRGYYHGGCGYGGGWYGTGIPNGLGWSLLGIGAAAAVAAPVVYAATAPAPIYYGAPVYYPAPASSVGYYNPPQNEVVEQHSQHVVRRTSNSSPSDNPTLVKVQLRLSALGYYKGNVDGNFGPQTELAVTKFQGENGLPITGRVDLKTLSSLGIAL